MDNDVYALLNKRIKGVTSGIKSISFENGILKFTTNDNIVINVTVPNMHTHSNQAILDKLNVVDGKLYYDGVLIDGHEHSNKTTLDGITNEKVADWNSKASGSHQHSGYAAINHTHNKSQITDFPTDLATETFVTNKIAEAQLGGKGEDIDLSGYATKEELNNHNHDTSYAFKSSEHSHSNKSELDKISVGDKAKWDNKSDFSGSYNDLTGKPAEFKPSSHRHDATEIDNLPTGGGGGSVSVVDNLTSTSTTSALSANQGRVIKSSWDNLTTRVTNIENSGGSGIVGDISPDKIKYVELIQEASPNLLNLYKSIIGYYSYPNSVEKYYNIPTYTTSYFIPVKGNTNYSKKHSTTKFLEYDNNKNFIKESASLNFNKTSANTVFVRVFMETVNKDTEIIVEGTVSASEYKPYNPSDLYNMPKENFKVELPSESITFDKIKSETIDEIYKEINLTKRKNDVVNFRNRLSSKDLFVETYYDGGNQSMHPTIVKFNTPWNGYKYWLGYTPYPFADDRQENPCVAVSNDLIYWETPTDGSNIPFDVPASEFKYWSDTHLLYNNDTNELELWYRGCNPDNTFTFVRKRSSDGISWGDREIINKPLLDEPSFVVDYENGKYVFYAIRSGFVFESSDNCTTWTQRGTVSIEYGLSSLGSTIWHYNITKDDNGIYHLLGSGYGSDKKTNIYYYKSLDGMYWTEGKILIKITPESDLKMLYRPCLVFENDLFYVYYTCVKKDESWNIRLSISENSDIYTIKGFNDYRNIRPIKRPKFGKVGDMYFDSKLGKPVYCKTEGYHNNYNDLYAGTTPSIWVDSIGNVISSSIINLTGITLNKSSLSLNVSVKEKLVATLSPVDTTQTDLVWTSSNNNIATVSGNGLVTAKTGGTCIITCKSFNNNSIIATCNVTVSSINVTGVSLNKSTATVNVGSTDTLTATISPSNATNKNVIWTSSNAGIATVSSDGVITGVANGSCNITCTTADGGFTAMCSTTVQTSMINVTGVALNKTTPSLNVGGTEQLTATITPSNATNKSVVWSSSDTNVATVSSSGVVAGVSIGSATITVTTTDGNKIATCNVTIASSSIAVTSISLNKNTSTLTVPNAEQLTATITPSNATNQNVTWTSSDNTKATVSSSGLVTSVASGNVTITATSQDGSHTSSCSYTIAGSGASSYTILNVTVPESPTTDQSTFKLSNISNGVNRTIEWYIDDVLQTLPTTTGYITNDTYTLTSGLHIIKIKGGFYASNNKCNIRVISIQNGLTSCNCMFFKSTDVLCEANIPETVTNIAGMFQDNTTITTCPRLHDYITDMSSFLVGCTSLTDIPNVLPISVTNLNSTFANCSNLINVNVNILPNTASDCTSLFAGTKITTVPIIPTNAVNVKKMFQNVKTITTLPQANIDLFANKPSTMTTTTECYNGCTNLSNYATIPVEWK